MRRPYSYKDKAKGKARNKRGTRPKKSPQPHKPNTNKMQDKAPCRECGQQLWEHPRCILCNRFMWCTNQFRNDAGDLMHSTGCQPI